MGLAVLQAELATVLGKSSAEELEREMDTHPTTNPQQESNLSWFRLTAEVLANATTAADVLSDLLNYDKIKHGQLQLELSVLSFGDLVKKSVQEFKLPASKKNLKLTVDFVDSDSKGDIEQAGSTAPGPVLSLDDRQTKNMKLVGDAARLSQVMRNFLSNAIKFTPDGGSIHVHVSWRETITNSNDDIPSKTFELKTGAEVTFPQCGEVKISVTDTGAGLSPDQLERLFRDGVQVSFKVVGVVRHILVCAYFAGHQFCSNRMFDPVQCQRFAGRARVRAWLVHRHGTSRKPQRDSYSKITRPWQGSNF